MAATKTVDDILNEVVGYLLPGRALRAAHIEDGGTTSGPGEIRVYGQLTADLFQGGLWSAPNGVIYKQTEADVVLLGSGLVPLAELVDLGNRRIRARTNASIIKFAQTGFPIIIESATEPGFDSGSDGSPASGVTYVSESGAGTIFEYDKVGTASPVLATETALTAAVRLDSFFGWRGITMQAQSSGVQANQGTDVLMQPIHAVPPAVVAARTGPDEFTGGTDPTRSILRLLLRGCSFELKRAHDLLQLFRDETPGVDPATGAHLGIQKLLPEWESALAIPDGCFPGTGTLAERRRDVLTKLASLGIQTVADFEALGAIYGVQTTVYPGLESPLFSSGVLTAAAAKFTIVIQFHVSGASAFPYTFNVDPEVDGTKGFLFVEGQVPPLECLFGKLKPANCQVLFLFVAP